MRRIVINSEEREKVRTLFGVTDKTVSMALNYRKDNELARKIRSVALQNGGREVGHTLETSFDINYMVQRFGDKVEIRVDRKNDEATLTKMGEVITTIPNITIEGIFKLQERANILAQTI